MKNYILIQNDGEIELNSFELIGASTKRGDNSKIGFFGSGLKYSIAFMMRNGIDFKIFSGLNKVEFTTLPETLKGKQFERICINGTPTSYTTTMGPTWEHQWFVLREIYCNAIDEGSCQMVKSTTIVEPSEGKTRIYIELTTILQGVIDKWDSYFSDERNNLFVGKNMYTAYLDSKSTRQDITVYKKTSGVLYRKGIKVYEDENFLYDYECASVSINEDRTAKSPTYLYYGITSLVAALANENYVANVLRNPGSREYHSLSTSSIGSEVSQDWVKFSQKYLLVVKETSGKYADKINESPKECFLLPYYFAKQLKKDNNDIEILGMGKMVGECAFDIIESTPKMNFLIKEVTASLSEMGYDVNYEIKVANFLSEDTLGSADIQQKVVYISDKTFEMGRRELALTIMEECEHIKSKCEDETRAFQNHIFSRWLSYMEDKSALFL